MVKREIFTREYGGWVLDPKPCINGALPQKLASAFYELFSDMFGGRYTPLVYCGHQLVNGTNYMIICKATYTTATPKTAVVQVILHETFPQGGIFGEFSILSIETIVSETQMGGYKLQPFAYMPGELTHDPIHDAFKQVTDELDGSSLLPLAFCGKQITSNENTNHMFICKSSLVGPEKADHVDVVVLSEKDKAFTILSITQLV